MSDLRTLKESIESMSVHHQIEVLRILSTRPNAPLNENQNGTFVNLSCLTDQDIHALKEYSEYVRDQQETLATIEAKKQSIQKKYFNDNKDITVNSTSA
jgi:restriction endonuclease S subunit